MSTLHGPFEGFFVGLPSPDAEARGVSRFHDLRLDWGTLRSAQLVEEPPESPADPTPVHWTVLGPILAELDDGKWYRLWLHDARLHWSRPGLARDDGDRSLWCVRGHLVGRLAAEATAGPRPRVPLWSLPEPRRFSLAGGSVLADDGWRTGCLPLLLLALLALAALIRIWPFLPLLLLVGLALAWRALPTIGSSVGGWGRTTVEPNAAWLLPLALLWLVFHALAFPCRAIPLPLWLLLIASAFIVGWRAGRPGGLIFLAVMALPLALTGWQRLGCRNAPGAVVPTAGLAPGPGRPVAAPGSEAAPGPGDAIPGPGEPAATGESAPPSAAGPPSGDADGDPEAPGEVVPSTGAPESPEAPEAPDGPGAPDDAGEWPSLPEPDRDAELVQSASRGPSRRIGLDAALSQGRLECGQTIHMSGDLLFPVESAKLRPESLAQLRKLHRVVQASPDVRVKLVGHADEAGEPEYNDALSRERAQAVGDWLLRWQALPASRLDLEGHGESEPLVRAKPASPLQRLNRRVEVVVSCPGGGDAGE